MTKPTPHYSPFGSLIPNRFWSDASRVYRYGFNGKEKDFETANDNYDFGARIYDGRLGRWLSLDPLVKKYPDISPHSSFGNSPISIIDEKGEHNIVYLVVLASTFTPEGGNLTWDDIHKYVEETNAKYKELGLETRVEIFTESTDNTLNENFDISKMDNTDVVTVIGSPQSVVDWVTKRDIESGEEMKDDLLDKKDEKGNITEEGGLASTSKTKHIIGMSSSKIKSYSKQYKDAKGNNLSMAQTFALTLLHETGHDVGLTHVGTAASYSNNSSSIMYSSSDIKKQISAGKSYSDLTSKENNSDFLKRMLEKYKGSAKRNYADPGAKPPKSLSNKGGGCHYPAP